MVLGSHGQHGHPPTDTHTIPFMSTSTGVTLEIVAKPLAEGGAAAYEQGIKRVFEGLTPDQVV